MDGQKPKRIRPGQEAATDSRNTLNRQGLRERRKIGKKREAVLTGYRDEKLSGARGRTLGR
jgi:hypothetical protein